MALNKSRSARFALLQVCALATIATGFITTAHAQSSEEAVKFDLPPQSLEQALKSFSVSADKQLMFATDLAEGKTVAGLSGEMEPMQALDELLDGTGLVYETTSSNVILVKVADADQGGASDSKNSSLAPILMAQNTSSPTQTTSSRSSESGTVVVTGKVTDARTGANLKGAKVTIEETGQWTSTGDLGRFRFASVPEGEFTLQVSFLGYARQSTTVGVRNGLVVQNFALRGGDEIDEIIVFGQRSARALALNIERTAENAQTVVSSDLLGNFTGTTISESLRRAPGIAFEQDFNTGDGANIIVRGLAPDLNTVTFNGIELPVGNGEDRSADLSSLLARSVSSVTINKTLLPNQDSAGIGGLIEIETQTPLNRDRRFAQFSASGRQRDSDFAEDYVLSGVLSGKFGDSENLGLGISVQYRDRSIRSVQGGIGGLLYGAYLPLDAEGGTGIREASQIAPGNAFPFVGSSGGRQVFARNLVFSENQTETENFTFGINGAWDIGTHTTLRFDAQSIEQDTVFVGSTYNFTSTLGSYRERPVLDQGGEVRRALGSDSFFRAIVNNGGSFSEQTSTTNILTFQGTTNRNRLSFDYRLGYTEGETSSPRIVSFGSVNSRNGIGLDALDPSLIDPIEGIFLSPFPVLRPEDENISGPLLSEASLPLISDPAGFRFPSSLQSNFGSGGNERYSAAFSTRYDFDSGPIRYIVIGIDYETSSFSSFNNRSTLSRVDSSLTYADVGLIFDQAVLGDVGVDTGLLTPSIGTIETFANSLDGFVSQGVFDLTAAETTFFNFGTRAEETEIAPYIQGSLSLGDFELIGGFRYSNFEIEADDLDAPRLRLAADATVEEVEAADAFEIENTIFRTEKATQRKLLPRFTLNYRPNEKTVVRAGYFQAIARPQLGQISDRRTFSLDLRPLFGPDRDKARLFISEGNEDLQPALTESFDLSLEYYDDTLGVFKLAGFYKRIENLTELNDTQGSELLDGLQIPAFPIDVDISAAAAAGDLIVERTNPVNNESDANIWGIEASVERQFTQLPGLWSGFGFYGNYTYSESKKDQPFTFRDPINGNTPIVISGVDFQGQPRHSGTAALTYNANSVDASLIYSAQSRRLSSFAPNGLSRFEEGFETLDFRFAYLFEAFGGEYQLSFEATDLLRDPEDPTLLRGEGEDVRYYTDRSFLGGREIRLGIVATF